jgi:xanthine/uracil permease
MSSQNNGVIALTRCANRKAGYAACFWLLIMGIFAKFAAALVAIPSAVLGGMTTFLFASVVASGIRIISTMPFTRRNRFILTASLAVGFGATLVPDWFECVYPIPLNTTEHQEIQSDLLTHHLATSLPTLVTTTASLASSTPSSSSAKLASRWSHSYR